MIPVRRSGATLLALAAICALVACEDGVFAPRAPVRQVARLSLATEFLGGSASAFDKCDAIHIVVGPAPLVLSVAPRAGVPQGFAATELNAAALDTTIAFVPAAETHVSVPVEISASTDTVWVTASLLSGGSLVFFGNEQVVLKRGETTPVAITMGAQPGAVSAGSVPTFTAIGDSVYAHGAVLFATGDTLRAGKPQWTSLTPNIVATPRDSLLVAVSEGQGQVRVWYGPLSQTVTVVVSATVASLTVAPQNPTLPLSAASQLFTAVARDRRRNVLVRTPAWSSSNTAVARIDAATGLAALVGVGSSYIVAAVGTVRDSTLLTVQPQGPLAPTSLTAAGASSAQINLSWNDNSLNESEFRIERCLSNGCTDFAQVFTSSGTTFTTGIRNNYDASAQMQPATTYGYRVRACNADGCSAYTNTTYASTLARETTAPTTPTSVTATAVSSNLVTVGWSHSGTNVVGFIVERAAGFSQQIFTQIAVLYGTNVVGYQDNSTVSATYYQYRVSAFNAAGTSAPSFIATVTTR